MQDDKNAMFQMRFPQKLWYLLNLRTDAILWGSTGRTILLNYRILQNYLQCDHSIFKTTNISSFVRQLNLYGFRKVTSHLQDMLCNSRNPYMHEYVHDYFQYGRPELLNKISRKALVKRSFKPKSLFNNIEQMVYLTPLQKARRALRMALKKAAEDLYMQNSPKQCPNLKLDCEESQEDCYGDDDIIDLNWSAAQISDSNPEPILPHIENADYCNTSDGEKEWVNYDHTPVLMNTTDSSQQNNTSFPPQFLSMPILDSEPSNSTVELLAKFNINHEVDGKVGNEKNEKTSLNCVLPSINSDQSDDVPMTGKNNEASNHFNSEWDQMFNDFIANKGSNQECGTELKELYSQISKTINLLNS